MERAARGGWNDVRYDLGMSRTTLNRRVFLGSAAAARAGAARVAATGASVSAAAQQRVGANDKIALAFIGAGVMGSENLSAAMEQGE